MDSDQLKYRHIEVKVGEMQAFAVSPIENCPHFNNQYLETLKPKIEQYQNKYFTHKCNDCDEQEENWICLQCEIFRCSRHKNNHMVKHFDQEGHAVALSCADLSFWCYQCDAYITNLIISLFQRFVSNIRFPEDDQIVDLKQITQQISKLSVENKPIFSRNNLINGLKQKKFKQILVLTGAGISVAAGIPDFRSPGTGLYDQLKSLNLPYPEAIFELKFFSQNPQVFYSFAAQFLDSMDVRPVRAHHFIQKLDEQKLLLLNLTQNIDGLELEAGLRAEKLVQAHGHIRSAHCIVCKAESDIKILMKSIKDQVIQRCNICQGLVKPDIIFFGEQLPKEFYLSWQQIKNADLLIVMGTSLKVQPFNTIPSMVDENVPIVLINRENVLEKRKNVLFLEGDIEDVIQGICKDLEWE